MCFPVGNVQEKCFTVAEKEKRTITFKIIKECLFKGFIKVNINHIFFMLDLTHKSQFMCFCVVFLSSTSRMLTVILIKLKTCSLGQTSTLCGSVLIRANMCS